MFYVALLLYVVDSRPNLTKGGWIHQAPILFCAYEDAKADVGGVELMSIVRSFKYFTNWANWTYQTSIIVPMDKY